VTDNRADIHGAMAPDPLTEEMEIQMGPSHPATHGTLKFNLRLDGETIRACETEIGYLHRGFEKMCEQGTWNQVIPYTDRLNYASPLINNFIFVEAVERLAGITVPARCSWIRTLLSEVSRIADHLTALGMGATELGAITVGFYMNEARERLYNLTSTATGARVTASYGRVGGLARDLDEQFFEEIGPALEHVKRVMVDCETLLESNRIFLDRMAGVGVLELERALDMGVTGPMLRACGLASDLRRDEPYMVYDELDFDVPVGSKGDNFDRFNVRFEEIFQSIKMVEQCIERMPGGPWCIDDPKLVLPPKEKVYGSIEGLMNQFKLVIEGVRIPEGEVYFAGEGANGELGFFLVSDGSGRPYRVRVRPPCFYSVAALESMVTGAKLSDLVAVFGMVNMIGGECDR
jgi:NADH-quinone oxidoreductase subunit D